MDLNATITIDLKVVKQDLVRAIKECSDRGLHYSVKWLAELNFAIRHIKLSPEEIPTIPDDCGDEIEQYQIAKSYFDLKEYDRSSYFLKDCINAKPRFLYFYSNYLSIEKKKVDNMTDADCPPDPAKNQPLNELYSIIKADYHDNKLDGYCLYLYGVILKKLDLTSAAIDVFVKSVNEEPLLWSAWVELALLLPSIGKLDEIILPDCWIKQFFLAHTHLEQLNNNEALNIYSDLHERGFNKSSFLLAQTAIVYHNTRDLDKAIEMFRELLKDDPYRLDNLDTFSNLLYVKEMKSELADLAHKAVTIDKYRVETCCVIGNYYSLRSDHPKAVLYFQRALKLNPHYLSAWTLMGHEYMEMKNTNAAIQSYRKAIEINRRDYRAWYGLGQTYEILKMPHYSLYYYKQSQQLRPTDSRMIIALGETYEKLEKTENALKCYYKACRVGDIEGIALLRLAKLYDKLNHITSAVGAYTEFCMKDGELKTAGDEEQSEYYKAFLYLANYHLKKGFIDAAYSHAYKCLEHEETKDAAKALLKTIAAMRVERDASWENMDETGNNSNMEQTNLSMESMVFSP